MAVLHLDSSLYRVLLSIDPIQDRRLVPNNGGHHDIVITSSTMGKLRCRSCCNDLGWWRAILVG